MRKSVTIILATLLIGASTGGLAQSDIPRSLRGLDVGAADPAPESHTYLGAKPGRQKLIDRTFQTQPPLIPHALENFDEITLQDNQCMECHSPETFKKKESPKIGDSHFLDESGKQQPSLPMTRHNCLQCHIPQTDAAPLVGNSFQGKTGGGQ